MRNPALSGDSPQEGQPRGHQQQAETASHAALGVQQPNAAHSQTGQGCPGTSETRFDCNTVSAIANVRQADAAERFNNLAVGEIGVGIITAIVAYFAAKFARDAANAATKSFKAFVAAEDAHLAVDLPDGTIIESYEDGVKQPNSYHLTLKITNIGRSTARISHCDVGGDATNRINIEKTLKRDETTTHGYAVMVESLDVFTLQIFYTSPIRNKAGLVVTARPTLLQHGRIGATILNTALIDLLRFGEIGMA